MACGTRFVVSGQADPNVGVGSQVLPIPMEDCGSESGESGGWVGPQQDLIVVYDEQKEPYNQQTKCDSSHFYLWRKQNYS